MPERNAQLVKWEAQYPLESLPMHTPDGILWENRGQASEAYFNDYSWDWEENLALLTDVREMSSKYGDYLMIAYPINQNFIADTYFSNPEPMVQDKHGDKDLSRMVTDTAASVINDSDAETKMKDALQDQFWAGFGMVYAAMRQKVWPVGDMLVPEWQRIITKTISPWKARFDPRGREWDMSDHGYFRNLMNPKLGQLMSWGWLTDDDRRRLIAWNRMGMRDDGAHLDSFSQQRIDYPLMADNEETDPDLIEIPMWANWDRTKKLVFFQPAGARFTLTPQPWPVEFAEADIFPFQYMAKNREPENKRGTNGFIGIPDMRQIRTHVLAIRRYRSLFLAANQHAIFKYLVPKGALTQGQLDKLGSDKQREVIEYDETALDKFPTQMRNDAKTWHELLTLVPQPDLKETRHLVGIKLEFDMIAQILGQASGDRGGVPETETATDALIVNQHLNQRIATLRRQNAKHFKELLKRIFLILKQRQVLPISYQMTTMYNEKVWMEFSADKLRELDLHFDVAIGTGEPRTREKEFELRERMAAILMPVLQAKGDVRGMMKVARELVEVLNIRGSEQYFNDVVLDLMKRLAGLLYAIQRGDVQPGDPRIVRDLVETLGQLVNEFLTVQDLQSVKAEMNNAPEPEPTSTGSIPKALSEGQRAYASAGSAMAGAVGGMA